MNKEKIKLVGWIGSVLGVLAALMLALNLAISPLAYIFFLVASISLLAWSSLNKISHQALYNLAFTVINLIGVYSWSIPYLQNMAISS